MTSILGKSIVSAKQMSEYLLSKNPNPKFSRNIDVLEFCQLFIDICAKEDVRGDISFAQSCKETGNFSFKGDVKYTQNNFAGLGATGNEVCGFTFHSIEEGILAQAQHLKTYATKSALNEKCVDPRRTTWFVNTKGGTSPNVETLAGTWAVPGYNTKDYSSLQEANVAKDSYGYQIINILNQISQIKVKEENNMGKKNPIIALSAGHGRNTAGKRCMKAVDPNETREWYLNDRIIDKVENKLKSYQCTVVRVNDTTGNVDTPLRTRAKTSDNANADFYLAMHHNAGISGGSGGGTVVFYYSSKAERKEQAEKLYNAIVSQTGLIGNRSAKVAKSNLFECREPKAPSLLVENGFMDSKTDTPIILTDLHAEKTAIGVVNFLVDILKLEKNSANVSDTTTTTTSPSTKTYTVVAGDTLSKIGEKTGVEWKTIAELNGIKSPYVVKVGQVLKLTNLNASVNQKFVYQGLDYSLVFNSDYYVNRYDDLKKAFGTNVNKLFSHFCNNGMKEGRQASDNFNVTAYKNRYVDLQNAFGNNLPKYYEHYIAYGVKEGRSAV